MPALRMPAIFHFQPTDYKELSSPAELREWEQMMKEKVGLKGDVTPTATSLSARVEEAKTIATKIEGRAAPFISFIKHVTYASHTEMPRKHILMAMTNGHEETSNRYN